MSDLLINFYINFKNHHITFCPYGPLMYRWLPNNKQDSINFPTGNSDFILHGWFERCGYMSNSDEIEYDPSKHEIDESKINRQGILDAGILFCELQVKNVLDNEYNAIVNNQINDENYIKFTKKILPILQNPLNNFIRILKIKFGQYWLDELPPHDSRHKSLGSYCNGLQMKWSNDGGKNWKEFIPTNLELKAETYVHTDIGYYLNNYISENDWKNILEEIKNDFPSTLSLNTLIKCWSYFDQGDIDRSVIEGITSLELAIEEVIRKKLSRFNKTMFDIDDITKSRFQEKILLISSFNESITTAEVTSSLELYDVRNKLVHDGISPEFKEVRSRIFGLLNTISKLILSTPFRFPSTNHGNSFKDPAEWEKLENEYNSTN